MTSYTEDQIFAAWHRKHWMLSSAKELLAELKKEDAHVHDFTDDDTITVKEIREAFPRTLNFPSAWTVEDLLKDISEHREPKYLVGTVWQDAHGAVYLRGVRCWKKFGTQVDFADNVPVRPLKRMDVTD
jgi:hypothetical protein